MLTRAPSKKPDTVSGQLCVSNCAWTSPRTIVCNLQIIVRNLLTKPRWPLVRSYALKISARRTTPYEEVVGLECEARHQSHASRAAWTWHRGLRSPLWNRKSLVCSSVKVMRWISWCKAISKTEVKYWISAFICSMLNRYLAVSSRYCDTIVCTPSFYVITVHHQSPLYQ